MFHVSEPTAAELTEALQKNPNMWTDVEKEITEALSAEIVHQLDDELTLKPHTEFEDPFSEEVWRTTYKDHNDETVDDTFMRVANAVASVESTEELKKIWTANFYDLLSNFKATAGGRIYSNAGTEWKGTTLLNCYVSPRVQYDPDSLEGILKHLKQQMLTLKSEGGWGENFSYIRPRGSFIHGIGIETPGAIKYMELFDKSSEIITAGSGTKSSNKKSKGKIRKGAQMGIIDCSHPDVIEFITAKQQPGRLTKFNISVNCTDQFMEKILRLQELKSQLEKAEKDTICGSSLLWVRDEIKKTDKWDLRFPDTTFHKYKQEWQGDLQDWENKGYPVKIYQTISALTLWNLITESTFNRNEPGILFLDRANYYNPLNYVENIAACNPCSEQMLAFAGVCNLGSINLTQFIDKNQSYFDLDKLKKYAKYLVRFLDNVNSLTNAPLQEYKQSAINKRRIGCGILGWGSALYMMKIPFGSKRAADLRDNLMETYAQTVYMASIDLAEEKGMFPLCQPEKHAKSPFIKNLHLPTEYIEKLQKTGIRNSSCLSIQPTGNTAIFANIVSGGLEPVFLPEYIRTVIVSEMPLHIKNVTPKWYEGEWYETEMFNFTHEGDEEILKGVDQYGIVYKIDKNRGLTKEVLCEDYGVRQLKKTGEWKASAPWAKTTVNLSAQDHINDLKGFARWLDSSASKTINLPNDYPLDQFKDLYLDAYKTGFIKGMTTYRAGTMTTVLAAKDETAADEEIILDDVKLPDSSEASMKVMRAEAKKWYLSVVWNETRTRPFALFVHTNNHEKTVTTEDAVEKLIDLATEKRIPQKHIDACLAKIANDSNPTKLARVISLCLRHGILIKNIVAQLDQVENVFAGSFLFQIKKFLSSYIKDGERVEGKICDNCGSNNIVFSEGCATCKECGSSKCG